MFDVTHNSFDSHGFPGFVIDGIPSALDACRIGGCALTVGLEGPDAHFGCPGTTPFDQRVLKDIRMFDLPCTTEDGRLVEVSSVLQVGRWGSGWDGCLTSPKTGGGCMFGLPCLAGDGRLVQHALGSMQATAPHRCCRIRPLPTDVRPALYNPLSTLRRACPLTGRAAWKLPPPWKLCPSQAAHLAGSQLAPLLALSLGPWQLWP